MPVFDCDSLMYRYGKYTHLVRIIHDNVVSRNREKPLVTGIWPIMTLF